MAGPTIVDEVQESGALESPRVMAWILASMSGTLQGR